MFEEPAGEGIQIGPTAPLPLRFRVAARGDVPEGKVLLETLLGGHAIARGLVDAAGALTLTSRGDVSAPLLLQAEESEGGIEGHLIVLFPVPEDRVDEMLRSEEEAEEPWRASAPSFDEERGAEIPEGAVPMMGLLLGDVKRLAEERQHPGDAYAEAESLLQAVLAGPDPGSGTER
jgi:hypothetical protein